MENMYVHQHTKGEPNWFNDGAVIITNAHTCSPPTQTLLFTIYIDILYT